MSEFLPPKAITSRVEVIRTVEGSVLVWRSALTYNVKFRSDAIGKGKQFATAKDYADAIGVSASQVTRYTRLGRAIVLHGVPTDGELWKGLTRIVNDDERDRTMLDSDEVCDIDELSDAVSIALANPASGPTVTPGESEESTETPSKGKAEVPNSDLFAPLHDRIGSIVDGKNPAAMEDFLTRAAKLVEAAQTALATMQATPARKGRKSA
jgi:hypothetical protein